MNVYILKHAPLNDASKNSEDIVMMVPKPHKIFHNTSVRDLDGDEQHV